MQVIDLAGAQALSGEAQFAAYACLDTTGTREIFDTLLPLATPEQSRVYAWSRAQLSPAITMTLRGVRVDEFALGDAVAGLKKDLTAANKTLAAHPIVAARWDGFALETGFCPQGQIVEFRKGKCSDGKLHKWGDGWRDMPTAAACVKCAQSRLVITPTTSRRHKWSAAAREQDRSCLWCGISRAKPAPFEGTSSPQCAHLFYDILKVPHIFGKDGNITTDDDALLRIGRDEMVFDLNAGHKKRMVGLKSLCDAIANVRDLTKQLGFLNATLSPQGRFHSSFNVAAPWTGRWSSSKDPFRRGGNMQNIASQHRHVFVADPGMEMFYADLKTAESMQVAYLSGCEKYIEAHKGDVHTWVCREVWPELPWTGDLKKDKEIAKNTYPEWDNVDGHDYRFQSKRVQHGSNYGLSPFGMAMIAHIPTEAARKAQAAYFRAFPEIRDWQRWMRTQVQGQLPLHNPFGRVARLFGRPWDEHTYKQGLAFPAQGGVGDTLNLGLYRLWADCDPVLLQLLAQVHDAILGQYPVARRAEALAAIKSRMAVKTPITDFTGKTRECIIPVEVAIGRNWGKRNTNPKKGRINKDGLEEV